MWWRAETASMSICACAIASRTASQPSCCPGRRCRVPRHGRQRARHASSGAALLARYPCRWLPHQPELRFGQRDVRANSTLCRRKYRRPRRGPGKLELKWAFGFPGDVIAFAAPTVVQARCSSAARAATVQALDARTGCIHWRFEANGPVRTPPTVAQDDKRAAAVHRPNRRWLRGGCRHGQPAWNIKVETHDATRLSGTDRRARGHRLCARRLVGGDPIGRHRLCVLHVPRQPLGGRVCATASCCGRRGWSTCRARRA